MWLIRPILKIFDHFGHSCPWIQNSQSFKSCLPMLTIHLSSNRVVFWSHHDTSILFEIVCHSDRLNQSRFDYPVLGFSTYCSFVSILAEAGEAYYDSMSIDCGIVANDVVGCIHCWSCLHNAPSACTVASKPACSFALSSAGLAGWWSWRIGKLGPS